jgi:tetratricopeptide (TPR) repeat protein
MFRSSHLFLALCAFCWLCGRGALAQAPAANDYETVVSEGLRAYQAGQYLAARASFEHAHALSPSARTLRALGMTAVELRRYSAAHAELEAALGDARQPLTEAQRGEVTQMLRWLESTLATLRMVVEPAGARVVVDGEPGRAPFLLEPGAHEVRVLADGYETSEQRLELAAAQERTLEVRLTPTPPLVAAALAPATQLTAAKAEPGAELFEQPSPARDAGSGSVLHRWWFWTAIGVAVVAGTTLAIVAASGSEHQVAAEPPGTKVLILRAGP